MVLPSIADLKEGGERGADRSREGRFRKLATLQSLQEPDFYLQHATAASTIAVFHLETFPRGGI